MEAIGSLPKSWMFSKARHMRTGSIVGQSLQQRRAKVLQEAGRCLSAFGKAEGDEMTVQVLGFNISMKNNSHQISR